MVPWKKLRESLTAAMLVCFVLAQLLHTATHLVQTGSSRVELRAQHQGPVLSALADCLEPSELCTFCVSLHGMDLTGPAPRIAAPCVEREARPRATDAQRWHGARPPTYLQRGPPLAI